MYEYIHTYDEIPFCNECVHDYIYYIYITYILHVFYICTVNKCGYVYL